MRLFPLTFILLALFTFNSDVLNSQWVQTNGPGGGTILSLAVSGINLFAGTRGGGVYPSTNNGTSWTTVNSGLTNTSVHALVVSPATDGTGGTNLFAGTEYNGVFLSTNNGTSWTAVNSGLTNTDVYSFAVSPNGAGGTNLFAGTSGGGIFLSTDNGTSWIAVNSGLTITDIYSFAVSGTNLFAGTSVCGVFLSTNSGANWSAVNSGLTITTINALVVSGTNLFAGTKTGGVFLSTNNGTNWTAVNSGLPNTALTTVNALAISPAIGGTGGTNLFAGTESDGVFLSTNNGTSWTAVNSGMTYTDVSSLAVSGMNLFAGTNAGVFLSTNNGTSWTAVNSGLTNTDVSSLAVSGMNLFAGTYGGVFLSTNNGTSWNAVRLINTNVHSFTVSGTNLFAAINGGVFLSTDNGTSWTAVNSGLTNTSVHALAVSGMNLFAGTWSGAVWKRPLSEMIKLQQFMVSGTVAYASTTANPIGNAIVTLTPTTGTALTTTSSPTDGTYSFASVPVGTYTLTASKTGNWGGVNANDALAIANYVVGNSVLTGLPLVAADVNSSGTINANDALQILLRVVGTNNSFTAGDWVFNSQTITVGTSNVTGQNISGLAVGDVNASYTPSSGTAFTKSDVSVSLSSNAVQDVASVGTFEVPVRVTSEMVLGAVSLKINFPADVATFVGVSSKLSGFVNRADEGSVTIVWADMSAKNAMQFNANEALVTLKFSPKAEKGTVGITVDSWSELNSADGTVISMAKLSTPTTEIGTIPTVFELVQNYPNPFNPATTISFSLPQKSFVSLKIFDLIGREVTTIVSEQLSAGNHSRQWYAEHMPSGVYYYRLRAGSFTETKKLLLLR